MQERVVLRYRLGSRVFHWLHSLAFVVLLLTGLARFLHPDPAGGFYTVSLIHRAAAGLFVGLPLLYYFIRPKQVGDFIKGLWQWNRSDIQWLKAAAPYYFGGPEGRMPPQGEIDPGQRAWELVIVVSGVIFVLTGVPLWFFKYAMPLAVYQWALSVHAMAFIAVFGFFLLHIYLGVFHPRFKESLRSMLDGRISPGYAKKHYPKWYEKEKSNVKSRNSPQ
jgi:formate dehydrogenase subunit gamma